MTNIKCVQKFAYIIQNSFPIQFLRSWSLPIWWWNSISLNRNWEFIFVFKTEYNWNPTRAKQIMFTPSHSISLIYLHYVRASKTITLKRLQMFRRVSIAYSDGTAVIQHSLLLTVMVQLWSSTVYCLQWWYSCDPAQSIAYSDGTAVIQHSLLRTVMVQLWSSTVYCLQWWYSCALAQYFTSDWIQSFSYSVGTTVYHFNHLHIIL